MARTTYAIRVGFGQEGHGAAIYLAEGTTVEEAKARAIDVLQVEFQGLWTSKLRDTSIGSAAWLRREFPGTGLDEVLQHIGE